VFSVSRYGSATVRFTVRKTSLQMLVSLHSSRLAATTTVVDVAAIVVVADVADAETTSNCHSYNNERDGVMSSLFCIFAKIEKL
jgi:hypothetical protein